MQKKVEFVELYQEKGVNREKLNFLYLLRTRKKLHQGCRYFRFSFFAATMSLYSLCITYCQF
jgi:hypothetical protein